MGDKRGYQAIGGIFSMAPQDESKQDKRTKNTEASQGPPTPLGMHI